jgi:AcrR family transcriptional regulator
MSERQRTRRPGGRSAKVGAAVHGAVTELISERGYGGFTIGEIAARAGVADSSIYRRWGNLEALLADVALTRLNEQSPMPDTGSLEGDLRTYAANVAREITGPDGLALVRLAVALSGNGRQGLAAAEGIRAERTRQLQAMLDRSADRGESAPDAFEVLDHILAPMYIRVLFGLVPLTPEYIDGLVDRLLLPRLVLARTRTGARPTDRRPASCGWRTGPRPSAADCDRHGCAASAAGTRSVRRADFGQPHSSNAFTCTADRGRTGCSRRPTSGSNGARSSRPDSAPA